MGQTSKLAQRRRIGALDMILLQVIHDLAHGKQFGSSRDAKQLARFAAAIRDLYYVICTGYSPKWAGEKLTLDADDVARLRLRIKYYLPRAAKLTYEERERLIVKIDSKNSVVRAFKKLKKEIREGHAETLRVKAAFKANEKRRREEWNQTVSEMQSGERYRKYRKLAKEGHATAVAMFEDVGLRVAELAD